jgi:3-methyladenine DNA glycosylase AlkD
MKERFAFFGIKTPLRREIQKPFLEKSSLPPKDKLPGIVKSLWAEEQREFQYFAQELAAKYSRQPEEKDIELYEYMITHKSWWDTVDFIAVRLVGDYFRSFPGRRNRLTGKWLASEDIWLQRTTVLFQLKYKEELDKAFLINVIRSLLGSEAFFINKAIGWILREYSKTDPEWVSGFVEKTPLDKLSRKEALRLISPA